MPGVVHDVTFGSANGALVLAQSSALSGSISSWEHGDSIDLRDILFDDTTTTLAYAANAENTGGTLTVSDGTHTVTLALLGQYAAADFALSADGTSGTLVTDPTVESSFQAAIALPSQMYGELL